MSDTTSKLEVPFFHGPDGRRITLAQLPRPGLKRWSPRHKAMVVAAVRHGLLTFDEACKRYNLDLEEYLSWYRSSEEVWPAGETKIERYRR